MLFCNVELSKPALTNEVSRMKIRRSGNRSGGQQDNSNALTVMVLGATL